MNINYSVDIHSYWHCGSGLSAGADVDLLAIKDKEGMPFIPGKTVKGLLREAVSELTALKEGKCSFEVSEDFIKTFGHVLSSYETGKASTEMYKGEAFFSNAELTPQERKEIISGQLSDYLFDAISQTAIDDKGIAVEHSLRKTQVALPCKLHGRITDVPDNYADTIKEAMGFIKCLGMGRNRGLGRCTFKAEEE